MTTKGKTGRRKPAPMAASDKADKLSEAHHQMWEALNRLTMIDLAADKSIDDKGKAEDYAHAIRTSAQCAIEKIHCAYDLIDEVNSDFIRGAVAEADTEA